MTGISTVRRLTVEELPAEARVGALDDRGQVQAFLDRVNPQHSVRADYELVELWGGVRDAASGAFGGRRADAAPVGRGVPYLASITIDPAARRQGLGGGVTAFLTRRIFDGGERLCTLAHYHPNESARRVYLRLGYRTTHQFSSGGIRRWRWSSRPRSSRSPPWAARAPAQWRPWEPEAGRSIRPVRCAVT